MLSREYKKNSFDSIMRVDCEAKKKIMNAAIPHTCRRLLESLLRLSSEFSTYLSTTRYSDRMNIWNG